MAIARITGGMLQSNLLRRGVDLAFDTDLVYLDVTAERIGIKTTTPTHPLHVIGGTTVDKLLMIGDSISTNVTNGHINIISNGTGFVVVPRVRVSDLTQTGVLFAGSLGEVTDDVSNFSYGPGGLTSTLATLGTLNHASNSITAPAGNIDLVTTGGATNVTSLTVGDTTSTEIMYSGPSQEMIGSADFTFTTATSTLNLTGSAIIDDVTIDGSTISTTASALTLTSPSSIIITGSEAIQVPVGTSTQRPATPGDGALRFNSEIFALEYYDGTTWIIAGTDVQAISFSSFTGDDVTTLFVLSEPAGDAANLIVSINGVVQKPGDAYGVLGTNLTFVSAPATGDNIDVRNITRSYSFDNVSDSTGATKVETINDRVDFSTLSTVRLSVLSDGTVDASASTAVRLPSYTAVETQALSTPVEGDTVFVSDGDAGTPCLATFDGTVWKKLSFNGPL